jgi:thiol-disulfide isomerase/thioredoxin
MLRWSFKICLLIFLHSCHKTGESIIITVKINNAVVKEVFLTDAYDWERPISKATNSDGVFILTINADKLKETIYSLSYYDEGKNLKKLNFYNHVLSNDSQKYVVDAFCIDTSFIEITGSNLLSGYYDIKAGNETNAFFRIQMMNFGFLENDVKKRTEQLSHYSQIISSYPDSKILLSKMIENKSVIKKEEILTLLKKFNGTVVHAKNYKDLYAYAIKKNDYPVFQKFSLPDKYGRNDEIYESGSKVNMLVFWASWCAPCRQEIPDLKKLFEKYNRDELNIVSISIDNSSTLWEKAIESEKMSWPQLLLPDSNRQYFTEKFEISAVPYTLFLDKNGKLIDRVIGNSGNTFSEYEQIINRTLK